MGTQITEKDKKLLYGLGIFVIVSMFYLIGIRPIMKSNKKIEKELDAQEIVYNTMKTKVLNVSKLEAYADSISKEVEIVGERYYDELSSSDVDRLFTNMATSKNLVVTRLDITTQDDAINLKPYKYSKLYKDYWKDLDSDSQTTSQSSTDTSVTSVNVNTTFNTIDEWKEQAKTLTDTTYSGANQIFVKLVLTGDKEQLNAFVDETFANESMHVVKYNWSSSMSRAEYVDGVLVPSKLRYVLEITISVISYKGVSN